MSIDEAAVTPPERLSSETVREELLGVYPKRAKRKREKQIIINEKTPSDDGTAARTSRVVVSTSSTKGWPGAT